MTHSEWTGPRTAIVTGGARRIGAALVRALAADGWHVLIHHHRSVDEAAAITVEIGDARTVAADLADPDAADRIMAAADGMPPARLLINNASLFTLDAADDFDAEGWDLHHRVNLRAPALLTQAFARRLEGSGLVVHLLDAKLAAPNPDFFSYTVSKMGLAGLAELQARYYAARGLRVAGIAPSVTLVSGPQSRADFDAVHAMNALRRGVEVAEIVAALRFILGSPTFTGQTITLDGGQRFLGLARDVQFLSPSGDGQFLKDAS